MLPVASLAQAASIALIGTTAKNGMARPKTRPTKAGPNIRANSVACRGANAPEPRPTRLSPTWRRARPGDGESGGASGRERVSQYVERSVVDVSLKNKHRHSTNKTK